MHTIEINDDRYYLPESWDDLTPEQLCYLVRLTSQDIPVEEIKISMMLYCLQARVHRHSFIYGDKIRLSIGQKNDKVLFRVRKKKYFLSPAEALSLSSLFVFLVKYVPDHPGTNKYTINPQLTENPMPTFRLRMRKFYGPDSGLYDLTYEQFALSLHYHQQMQLDAQRINHLLAVLFHSSRKFHPDRIERDSRILSHLSDEKKMVLYWFYLGCLQFIAEQFPRVFSGSGNISGSVYESQLRIIDSLAGSDMTKKEAVRKGLLYDALLSMDESIRKQEELEGKNE